MPYALSDFRHIRPHHEIEQCKILDWLAEVHARAAHCYEKREVESFRSTLKDKLMQLGLGKERIQRRGMHISDPLQQDWSKMEIYPVAENPYGHGFAERSHFFDREVTRIFERFYPDDKNLPVHLIHATCTGYVAPSPAQKLVSLRKAGKTTTVTHAYHMGCYSSIPAIRMASGFCSLFSPAVGRTDIVHTELCSLHLHPMRCSTEQLVVQSLFGDGFIKYSLTVKKPSEPHLKVLALHEEVIPDSSHCMTWSCVDKGLSMTLSKEVPVFISRALTGYIERLGARLGMSPEMLIKESFFAIHPGGPKILQQIQELLGLQSYQIEHSTEVLKNFGNMSSATLPHIWEKMLKDPKVAKKAKIISLAFGPGLSIAGGLFEKGA